MGYRKLGRDSAHRKALLRNLATSLVIHEQIETTEKKAMELRSYADKLVTLAKRNDLHARRQAAKLLFNAADENNEAVIKKLFDEIGPRYEERNGGYTRVIKVQKRRGDAADMAIVEFA